jgi:hypothetical protein
MNTNRLDWWIGGLEEFNDGDWEVRGGEMKIL